MVTTSVRRLKRNQRLRKNWASEQRVRRRDRRWLRRRCSLRTYRRIWQSGNDFFSFAAPAGVTSPVEVQFSKLRQPSEMFQARVG